ncbi:MAG: DUF362 domain-containing protein, partial [Candidatus Thorarchaeota archaeon]
KVAIVQIKNNDIETAVKEAVELLGGISRYIKGTDKILLKPNMLSAPDNEDVKAMVRTDPLVLEALSKMVIDNGKKVLIGDTCGSGHLGGTRSVLEKSGYLELGEKYQEIEVRSLEQNGTVSTKIDGKKLKEANLSKEFLETDIAINVPKMKTHSLTMYTGAIKNLFGTICGSDKMRIHALGATLNGFSQCLVDLFSFEKKKFSLHLMDAKIAVEGMGPGASGKAVRMNLILASEDAVALDATAVRLMGRNPNKIPTIRFAAEQGLGEIEEEKIVIVGEKVNDHRRKFKFPVSASFGKLPFARFSSIAMQVPKYVANCTGCKTCQRACPEQVITISNNKKGKFYASINYNGCISCFTCIEVCPEACYKTKLKHLGNILKIVGLILGLGIVVTTIILLVIYL